MERMVKSNEFCAAFGISRVTLWRWMRDKKIPEPKKIGSTLYWRQSVVDQLTGV